MLHFSLKIDMNKIKESQTKDEFQI